MHYVSPMCNIYMKVVKEKKKKKKKMRPTNPIFFQACNWKLWCFFCLRVRSVLFIETFRNKDIKTLLHLCLGRFWAFPCILLRKKGPEVYLISFISILRCPLSTGVYR